MNLEVSREAYRAFIRPMWPSYVAAAYAAGMLHGNPPGTRFGAMPPGEQISSVAFTATMFANLLYLAYRDHRGFQK